MWLASVGSRRDGSGGELAADLRERALLVLVEDGEGLRDALGVLGKQPVDDLAAARGDRDGAARRSDSSRVRTTSARCSSVVTTSVALAFDVRSRARRTRSSSSPPAVVRMTSVEKPVAERPFALEVRAQPAADGGLRAQQRVEGAMCQRIPRDERHLARNVVGGPDGIRPGAALGDLHERAAPADRRSRRRSGGRAGCRARRSRSSPAAAPRSRRSRSARRGTRARRRARWCGGTGRRSATARRATRSAGR